MTRRSRVRRFRKGASLRLDEDFASVVNYSLDASMMPWQFFEWCEFATLDTQTMHSSKFQLEDRNIEIYPINSSVNLPTVLPCHPRCELCRYLVGVLFPYLEEAIGLWISYDSFLAAISSNISTAWTIRLPDGHRVER